MAGRSNDIETKRRKWKRQEMMSHSHPIPIVLRMREKANINQWFFPVQVFEFNYDVGISGRDDKQKRFSLVILSVAMVFMLGAPFGVGVVLLLIARLYPWVRQQLRSCSIWTSVNDVTENKIFKKKNEENNRTS